MWKLGIKWKNEEKYRTDRTTITSNSGVDKPSIKRQRSGDMRVPETI